MKVGVTGGNGFIGNHVCDALRAMGHEPVIFDRFNKGFAQVFLGDVTDPVAVTELAAHVDGIIHLAAVLGTQETVANPEPAARTNLLGAINVLNACRQYELPVVNICVGNWWMRNSYSTTKHAAERLFEQYRDDLGLAANQVRVVNAYGPRQAAAPPFAPGKVRKIMPSFILRALCNMPIEVYGDGDQVSDCVYVSDVAWVLVRSLELAWMGEVFDRIVEVGPAEHSTVNDVAKIVTEHARALGAGKGGVVHLPMRPGEEPGAKVVADSSTLGLVGLTAADLMPLREGIGQTLDWFAKNEGVTWTRP